MIADLRIVPQDLPWFPSGPSVRAASLAIGAVLLWSTWPMLATFAQPAPPMLVFGLAAAVGFCAMFIRAALAGTVAGFVSIRPATMLFVATGLFANNLLYLLAMPRIGPAEANVIAYLWPVMLAGMGALVGRSGLTVVQGLGIATALVGAVIVIGPQFAGGLDFVGVTFAFASGFVFAVYALIRSYGREANDIIGPSMGLIAVAGIGLHFLLEPPATLDTVQMLAIAGIGVAPLSLSNMLWDQAGRTGKLALISAIAFFTPLVHFCCSASRGSPK
ncbi:DMT family transporter [Mesorhizobium sp. ORM8.1]